jgi:hypothetical protein
MHFSGQKTVVWHFTMNLEASHVLHKPAHRSGTARVVLMSGNPEQTLLPIPTERVLWILTFRNLPCQPVRPLCEKYFIDHTSGPYTTN